MEKWFLYWAEVILTVRRELTSLEPTTFITLGQFYLQQY